MQKIWKIGIVLLLSGVVSIGLSLYLNSTILAFIGLTLLIWGILFQFLLVGKYVRSEIADSMLLPFLLTLDRMMKAWNYRGKAIYLPPFLRHTDEKVEYLPAFSRAFHKNAPQELDDLRDTLVFIPTKDYETKFVIEQVLKKEGLIKGMYLIPPGRGLAGLIEKHMEDPLDVDMNTLEDSLSDLMVRKMRLAGGIKIELDQDIVRTRIKDMTCKDLCPRVRELTNICPDLGCPIPSSVACILTKVTGKPVIIESCAVTTRDVKIQYRILEA